MNNTISTFSPSFQGKLVLNDKTIVNYALAAAVLNNKTLQDIATKSNKDIFISQSVKTARSTQRNHYKGEILYKMFLSTKDDSFLGKVKQMFGLNKISLSKNYHSPLTFQSHILQSSHLTNIAQKLNIK